MSWKFVYQLLAASIWESTVYNLERRKLYKYVKTISLWSPHCLRHQPCIAFRKCAEVVTWETSCNSLTGLNVVKVIRRNLKKKRKRFTFDGHCVFLKTSSAMHRKHADSRQNIKDYVEQKTIWFPCFGIMDFNFDSLHIYLGRTCA